VKLELYAPRPTAIHGLHPATKIVLLATFMVGPFLSELLSAQLFAIIAALAAARAARVLAEVLRPWKLILFLFVVTVVVWSAFNAWGIFGEGGYASGAERAATIRRSLVLALAYSLRVTAIFLMGLLFLATTRIEETVHGLAALGVPFRLAFALGIAFRLVPLFLASAASIKEAQEARGLDLAAGSLLARLKRYVPILVPIFMTSLRSADHMAMALEARGFDAPGPRTRLRRYAFGLADAAALALAAAFVAACVSPPVRF
jgi:energy-coupling factor transport system permease protein